MLGGMVNFTANTSISVIGYFRTSSAMVIFNMKIGLGTSLVWIDNVVVPIENRFNFIANITSFHNTKMHPSSLRVSLDFEWIWTFLPNEIG
jgi:hypothetical protein